MADIESRLVELERQLASSWSSEVLAEIQREVSLYEEARTLAGMLRRPWASNYVTEVIDNGGGSVTGSNDIMQVFTNYFARLYAAPAGPSGEAIQAYFEDIAMVWFEEAHRAYLDEPFTLGTHRFNMAKSADSCGALPSLEHNL
ncbi:hypothetical protein NDU88_002401 [Pleurodeles waltl]|uniref:Uncharacterized protein n=1 Tax=Pleurodeles waltl TaxID=8319 RepID=A0AAV7T2N2_PLEWA|nr:hypothetical protein NDU88_002401 [Pleurodeles waltl]